MRQNPTVAFNTGFPSVYTASNSSLIFRCQANGLHGIKFKTDTQYRAFKHLYFTKFIIYIKLPSVC